MEGRSDFSMTERRAKSEQLKREKPAGKAKRKKRIQPRTWFFLFLGLFAASAVAAMGTYFFFVVNGTKLLLDNQDQFGMAQASIVYDSEGKEVSKLFVENREVVTLDQVPKLLQDAFIATEDRRFWEHQGVDVWSIGRALYKDILHRSAVEGGSTITQQLAKNIFFAVPEKTLFRKAKEASIALALERRYSKEQILEMYLNRIYFGSNGNGQSAWGIKSAVKMYFGKELGSSKPEDQLTLAEIATLAGLPKSPNGYSPFRNPERSKERRGTVLYLMAEQGLITEEQRKQAAEEELKLNSKPASRGTYAAYIDYVEDEALRLHNITPEELRMNGYRIYTALDTKAQQTMEQAFANDALFQKQTSGQTQKQEAGMVILDQKTGGIVAMAGGRDYSAKGFNRATAKRQPGSSFKPVVVYAPALETGNWHPYSKLEDKKQCYGNYCPENYNYRYQNEVDMFQAIRDSLNQPAVWLLNQIGVDRGMSFAEKLGIELDKSKDRNLAIALGGLTQGVSPLEMAQAYGAFANNGLQHRAHAILKIVDADGREVYKYNEKPKQVMSAKTAYYMTLMLQDVVTKGTGKGARFDRPVAGKTGSTQLDIKGLEKYYRDIWFVGYTPEWTAAVWLGFDKTDSKHYVNSDSGRAATLFKEVMSKALAGKPKSSFARPSGVPALNEPPSAVTDLTAEYDPQNRDVRLKWTPVGEAISYKVYRSGTGEGEQTPRLLSTTPVTELRDISVLENNTYTYYVVAFDTRTNLEAGKSNDAQVTVPAGGGIPGSPLPSVSPLPSPSGSESPDPSGSPTPKPNGSNKPGGGNGDGDGQNNGDGNGNGRGNGNGNGRGNGNGGGNRANPSPDSGSQPSDNGVLEQILPILPR